MIEVQLSPPEQNTGHTGYLYQLANTLVWFDQPVDYLSPFTARKPGLPTWSAPLPVNTSQPLQTIYQGPGWIANEWRAVHCQHGGDGYVLSVPGAGVFSISMDGARIKLIAREPSALENVIIESTLGPALILALALQSVWCLHASAALYHDHLFLFSGESGEGKSTLARYLASQPNWRRAGDDIMPVTRTTDYLYALPHFPQLKISMENQPASGLATSLKIHIIILLVKNPQLAAPGHLSPISESTATLALSRHSVAARLFGRDLLKKHLAFCAWVSKHIQVVRLDYPHSLDKLKDVQRHLESLVG